MKEFIQECETGTLKRFLKNEHKKYEIHLIYSKCNSTVLPDEIRKEKSYFCFSMKKRCHCSFNTTRQDRVASHRSVCVCDDETVHTGHMASWMLPWLRQGGWVEERSGAGGGLRGDCEVADSDWLLRQEGGLTAVGRDWDTHGEKYPCTVVCVCACVRSGDTCSSNSLQIFTVPDNQLPTSSFSSAFLRTNNKTTVSDGDLKKTKNLIGADGSIEFRRWSRYNDQLIRAEETIRDQRGHSHCCDDKTAANLIRRSFLWEGIGGKVSEWLQ